MISSAAPPRPAGASGRVIAALGVLAAALVVAFVVAPPALTADRAGGIVDRRDLSEALRAAFVAYWRSGDRDLPPDLARVVDYWSRYHLVKAVLAALLLTVLVALGFRLARAFVTTGGLGAGKRAALAAAGVLVAVLAPFSLAMVMANVQGAVAPFASLLPMLTEGVTDADLADTLTQVEQGLAESGGTGGSSSPALDLMIDDFSWYHEAMAGTAAVVAVVLVATSVLAWRRFAATRPARKRQVLAAYGLLSALLLLPAVALAVANATTAADPAPALLAFFQGGW
ncbi:MULTISPECIES: hypothetical protein [unclassified Micromonospora]|uniref:hypothetical protein n=1 Tax=unclassified Micromonospora TaxID=2617518 RepID=UPI00098D0C5A|nr:MULTISPECIES: hypothetical protein [unclassified Micromonospora]MDI5938364.1 hypothetical protein [Micromonospora sp. DH15]